MQLALLLAGLTAGCRTDDLQYSERVIERTLTPRVVTVTNPRAVDGDTIDAGGLGRVRLVGIDCPEVGEAGADAATRFTAAMVDGNSVHLAISPLWPKDVYGRWRAAIYITGAGGPVCINAELLRQGLARPSTQGPEAFDVVAWAKRSGPRPPQSRLVQADRLDRYDTPVYLTPTGTKYHRPGCRHARNATRTTLQWAVSRGYEPCGVCFAPAVSE